MTGLAVGLRVGLPVTAHWEAKSLNLCKVAMGDGDLRDSLLNLCSVKLEIGNRNQIRQRSELGMRSEELDANCRMDPLLFGVSENKIIILFL